jgi:multiple antibiotic resistance protein
MFRNEIKGEPLIVPMAIPAVAGPSIMAVLMLMPTTTPVLMLFFCLSLAWLIFSVILLAATPLNKYLGERGLTAVERLMGMLLMMMAVQMMINAYQSLNLPAVS